MLLEFTYEYSDYMGGCTDLLVTYEVWQGERATATDPAWGPSVERIVSVMDGDREILDCVDKVFILRDVPGYRWLEDKMNRQPTTLVCIRNNGGIVTDVKPSHDTMYYYNRNESDGHGPLAKEVVSLLKAIESAADDHLETVVMDGNEEVWE